MPAFMHVCAETTPEFMGAPVGLVLFFICFAVIATQLVLCWKTENILLWLVPVAVDVICILVFFLFTVNTEGDIFYVWLNLLVASLFSLASIGLSWGIFWLWNFLQNNTPGNPAGY